MGGSATKHQQKIVHVSCSSGRSSSSSSSSEYSSDSEASSQSSVDRSTNRSHADETSTSRAANKSTFSGKVKGECKHDQENNQRARQKESNFIETSEFPYARAKLVHPQTSREYQEARNEARRKEGLSTAQQTWNVPSRSNPEKHVMFTGNSQHRAERTINPHILRCLHSNGSGINVVPSSDVPRRTRDYIPISTWRNPNRGYTYFREQTIRPLNEPVPTNDDVAYQYDESARVVRPPTPCAPANKAIWSNSGAVFHKYSVPEYTNDERKALIRAQYKLELESIRQMTNQYSRMSTTGHR